MNVFLIDGKEKITKKNFMLENEADVIYQKKIHYMDVADMRLEGMSLSQIGEKKGLSRERIRQILNRYFFDITFKKCSPPGRKRSLVTFIKIECKFCKKIKTFRNFKENKKRKFCSFKCYMKYEGRKIGRNVSGMTKEEYRKYNRIRGRRYYRVHKYDPEFRAKIKKYNQTAYNKKHPVSWISEK